MRTEKNEVEIQNVHACWRYYEWLFSNNWPKIEDFSIICSLCIEGLNRFHSISRPGHPGRRSLSSWTSDFSSTLEVMESVRRFTDVRQMNGLDLTIYCQSYRGFRFGLRLRNTL
jgi:hypothetical protein